MRAIRILVTEPDSEHGGYVYKMNVQLIETLPINLVPDLEICCVVKRME